MPTPVSLGLPMSCILLPAPLTVAPTNKKAVSLAAETAKADLGRIRGFGWAEGNGAEAR